jgi:hypothetical protein
MAVRIRELAVRQIAPQKVIFHKRHLSPTDREDSPPSVNTTPAANGKVCEVHDCRSSRPNSKQRVPVPDISGYVWDTTVATQHEATAAPQTWHSKCRASTQRANFDYVSPHR